MPPRWPRQPDRSEPDYRKLDDRMNFAVHVALFAASNSGLWFFRAWQSSPWPWTPWLTSAWLLLLIAHGVYIFAIANYSEESNG
ncbi:2TM domain-containing protein [Laspinema palackyanum]|uniref:2TM domain-containing protein n=1 Tax=Laspinema palackyanum TaxID=3231601 RepID=UPI00345D3A1B|nr:2TM domain-containing protein [Laspinema sp. D2c]MCT7961614.1 2TM domain-containing protein [Laspinema sp. D2b]